jgi:MFS family permease
MTSDPGDVTASIAVNGRSQRRDDVVLRGAYIVSSVGDWIYRFALPLVVLQRTDSALATAFTYVLEFLPYIVVGMFAGAVADRLDRRRLMIGGDATAAVLVGLMAVLLLLGHPPVALLFVMALLLAAVRPVYFPAFQGFMVDRVPENRRGVVNAWVQGVDSTLNMVGPVAGLGIVVWAGAGVACAANAGSFALSALLICTFTTAAGAAGSAPGRWREVFRNVGADFRTGLSFVVNTKVLLWGTILMTVLNFATQTVESNLVYVIAGHGAVTLLGVVFAANGAGALLGAVLAPAVIRRVPVGRTLVVGMFLMAVALVLPSLAPAVPLIAAAWFLVGVAISLIVVPWMTFRQSLVPGALIGRVASVGRSLSYISIPFGALFGGWIVSGGRIVLLFVAAGVLQGLVWLGTVLSPLRTAGESTDEHNHPPVSVDSDVTAET